MDMIVLIGALLAVAGATISFIVGAIKDLGYEYAAPYLITSIALYGLSLALMVLAWSMRH